MQSTAAQTGPWYLCLRPGGLKERAWAPCLVAPHRGSSPERCSRGHTLGSASHAAGAAVNKTKPVLASWNLASKTRATLPRPAHGPGPASRDLTPSSLRACPALAQRLLGVGVGSRHKPGEASPFHCRETCVRPQEEAHGEFWWDRDLCLQNECFGVLEHQKNTGEGVRASLSRFFFPFSDTDLMF